MKGFLFPGLIVVSIMAAAIAWGFASSAAMDTFCRPDSPHGPRIGDAVLIEGCQ